MPKKENDQVPTNLISLTWCDCDCPERVPMDGVLALRLLRVPNPNRMCPSRRCSASDSHARSNSTESCSNGSSDWALSMVVATEVVVDPSLYAAT